MASISSPGIGSGLDINSLVSQLVAAEAQPAAVRIAQQEASFQGEISAVGSLKGALATFRSAAERLTDLSLFQPRKATSSDSEFFTASATSAAAPGKFAIIVERLAQAQKLRSDGFTDAQTAVGSGSLTITVNGDVFSVGIGSSANTLGDIRDAINESADNSGVTATILTVDAVGGGTESQLVLSANQTGADNSIKVTVSDDDGNDTDAAGLSALAYDPTGGGGTNLTELSQALDAQIRVDGQLASVSSNTVTTVLEGVTLDLLKADLNTTLELDVSNDQSALEDTVGNFVAAYNAARGTLDQLAAFDEVTGERGALLGDATLRTITSVLRREISNPVRDVSSPFRVLSELGIEAQDDGTLKFDSSKFGKAVESGFDGVGRFFTAADGMAVRIADALKPYVESNGLLDGRTDGLKGRIDALGDQRVALDRRVASFEARMLRQFTAMDAAVSQLQTTSNFLSQQLTALQNLASRPTKS